MIIYFSASTPSEDILIASMAGYYWRSSAEPG
jgi:hypothetical protein